MTFAASAESLERERARAVAARQRQQRAAGVRSLPCAAFLARTEIEVPVGAVETARVPFQLWPAQQETLATLERERLIVFLKARQLGISWLTCGYVLDRCVRQDGQPWLLFSQGQLEANELTRRISLMYHAHQDRGALPPLVKDNTQELVWANGSRVLSLPASRKAGRSFTAAGVVLDEWAFMTWGAALLAAVKPVIDAGGQLIIISTADGQGTPYHQFWQAAESGQSGYTPIFLPWFARPDRGPAWREQQLREAAGDSTAVLREYPANAIEAFTAAAGRVYDVWSDGPDDGNVTPAADYLPDGGPVYWAIDDGYVGRRDATTGRFTADSHPRVVLLIQERADGRLCVFQEHYAAQTQQEAQIAAVQALDYPAPEYVAVDSASADLRGRLHTADIYTQSKPQSVEESIKVARRMLAPDAAGYRRVLVHPRCADLRFELASYRYDARGVPIKEHDHGPDALRYFCYTKRME